MEQKLRRDRNIGSNLKVLREKHNISQEKLCALLQSRGCDIGRATYAKYMTAPMMISLRDWTFKNSCYISYRYGTL